MKAILKSNRNIIVDIDPNWEKFSIDPENNISHYYRGKDGNLYNENEIEMVEYYGN